MKTETTAQEALRLLKPVPSKQWCITKFVIPEKKQCCALGHWHRLKNNKGSFQFQGWQVNEGDLRYISERFIREKYGKWDSIASVNNRPETNNYKQKSIKARVIALLKDMVKAGL